MTTALDVGIALLLFGLAAWTIGARDTFSAVIGFVVYGLLVGLVWVRLSAVDVALTETAIGSGVTGMLLIGAAVRVLYPPSRAPLSRARSRPAPCRKICAPPLSAPRSPSVSTARGPSFRLYRRETYWQRRAGSCGSGRRLEGGVSV